MGYCDIVIIMNMFAFLKSDKKVNQNGMIQNQPILLHLVIVTVTYGHCHPLVPCCTLLLGYDHMVYLSCTSMCSYIDLICHYTDKGQSRSLIPPCLGLSLSASTRGLTDSPHPLCQCYSHHCEGLLN